MHPQTASSVDALRRRAAAIALALCFGAGLWAAGTNARAQGQLPDFTELAEKWNTEIYGEPSPEEGFDFKLNGTAVPNENFPTIYRGPDAYGTTPPAQPSAPGGAGVAGAGGTGVSGTPGENHP